MWTFLQDIRILVDGKEAITPKYVCQEAVVHTSRGQTSQCEQLAIVHWPIERR